MSDEVKAQLKEICNRLDVYNDHLKEHMARTALLEASLESQYKIHDLKHESLESRMEKQEAAFNGLPVRILQFVSILSGIAVLLKNLF